MSDSVIPKAALDKLARRYGLGQYAGIKPTTTPTGLPGKFTLTEQDDRYVLNPVFYRGELYRVGLSKKLLDNGDSHTQDAWLATLKDSPWHVPSGPLMLNIVNKLYEERAGEYAKIIKKVQGILRKDFKDNWMSTSTRVRYTASGLDEVTHDYGTNEEWSVEADVVGPSLWVDAQSNCGESLDALLGTNHVEHLTTLTQWLNKQNPYLWRVNNRPQSEAVRALVLGVIDSNSFYVYADGFIDDVRPVRGVASQKIFQ